MPTEFSKPILQESRISDFRFQITDSRLQIPDYRFQITDSDFKLQISDFRFNGQALNKPLALAHPRSAAQDPKSQCRALREWVPLQLVAPHRHPSIHCP